MKHPLKFEHPSGGLGVGVALVAACLTGCQPATLTEPGQAGLVVRGPSGVTRQACVPLTGKETNGENLLLATGWDVTLDASNTMGSIICSIEGEGCDYPAEKCFCQCSALGSCSYWAYFTMSQDGQWVYSPLGPRAQPVLDEDLHAWVWVSGTSSAPGAQQALLPSVRFSDVCPSE
jgi:hypothetical protein